jgi:ABC-type glutathione transport system ATPase component
MTVPQDPPCVDFDDIKCQFRHRDGSLVDALRGVTFSVPAGQLVCILGRSGHG